MSESSDRIRRAAKDAKLKATRDAVKRRVEAAALEDRGDSITRSMAVLDMERQRLYAQAAALRKAEA